MIMDKNTFWRLIDEVNSQVAGTDYDGILRATQEKLLTYTPEEIADWGSIQRYYKDMADTGGIFATSCFLNDYMSDDGFNDFRMWLISRGKDTYMTALKNPDSLADLELPEDIQSMMDTRWEGYGYVANYAYRQTGRTDSVYDVMERRPLTVAQKADIRVEIDYFPHPIQNDAEATLLLPKLHKKYGKVGFNKYFPDPVSGTNRFYRDAIQIAARYGYRAEVSPIFDAAFDILERNGERICAINKRVGMFPDSFTTLPKNEAFCEMMSEIRTAMEYFELREQEGHFDHAIVREPSLITYYEQAAKLIKDAKFSARLDIETDEILEIINEHSRQVAKVNGYSGSLSYNGLIPNDLRDAVQDLRLRIPFENAKRWKHPTVKKPPSLPG